MPLGVVYRTLSLAKMYAATFRTRTYAVKLRFYRNRKMYAGAYKCAALKLYNDNTKAICL